MKIRISRLFILIIAIVAITIAVLGCVGYKKIDDSVNLMQTIHKEEIKEMTNPNLSEDMITTTLKDNWTVAIFGLDSRDSDLSSSNSDVIMLASVNNKTGDIKLSSVYRDTCLKTGNSRYQKVNEAYGIGGPKKAVEVLNENLDLQIDDYIAVNWAAVATTINILDGVDIEITDSEFYYINSYITETVEGTGIGSHHLKKPGMNHLDGIQAVAYSRLRYSDNDFKRTERQRLVLSLVLDKAKKADWATINNIIVTVFPMVSTSIDTNDLIYLGKNVLKYNLKDTSGFPFDHVEKRVDGLDYVFPNTLESNVSELHKFLYGTENYEPSEKVKEISNKVNSKKNKVNKPKIKETVQETIQESVEEIIEETLPEEVAQESLVEETESVEESETSMYDIPEEERNSSNYGPGFANIEPETEETIIEETLETNVEENSSEEITIIPEETME